jgi:hypothetical protein
MLIPSYIQKNEQQKNTQQDATSFGKRRAAAFFRMPPMAKTKNLRKYLQKRLIGDVNKGFVASSLEWIKNSRAF